MRIGLVIFLACGLIIVLAQCIKPDLTIPTIPVDTTAITSFSFSIDQQNNITNGITLTVYGTIDDTEITVNVASAVTLDGLIATFSIPSGSSATVNGTTQTSGDTPNNFSDPVTYKITAGDGSFKDYRVTVNKAATTLKINRCYFPRSAGSNNGLYGVLPGSSVIEGKILTNTIFFKVPYFKEFDSWNNPSIIYEYPPEYSQAQGFLKPQSDNNNQKEFTYTITDTINSEVQVKVYTVYINMITNSKKEFVQFGFTKSNNPNISADSWGVITGYNIHIGISPAAIGISSADFINQQKLKPTFKCSDPDAVVTLNKEIQESNISEKFFTSPLTYTVTAEDATTQNYIVNVFPAPAFTSFKITLNGNDINGVIDKDGSGNNDYAIYLTASEWPATVIPTYTVFPDKAEVTFAYGTGTEEAFLMNPINVQDNIKFFITDPVDSTKVSYMVFFL